MKTTTLLTVTAVLLVASSCHRSVNQTSSSSKTTTTTTVNDNTTTTTTTTTTQTTTVTQSGGVSGNGGVVVNVPVNVPADTSNIRPLVVSFISKGGGIDLVTFEAFEQWLASHPSKPQYEKTHWGREGETNLCFRLSEFSTVSRAKFVADVRNYLTDKELVLIQENAACSKR